MRSTLDTTDQGCIYTVIVMLLVLSAFQTVTASTNTGTCIRWPNTTVTSGTKWQERCRQCQCLNDGRTQCSESTCTHPYQPNQEDRCEQWSSDSCCCERLVCRHNGEVYDVADTFLVREKGHCMNCTCTAAPGERDCVGVDCGAIECADPLFTAKQCCHTCPKGRNCRLPPLYWPENGEAPTVDPVPFNETRIIFSLVNSRFAWSCTCKMPGSDAECSRQAQLFHMRFTHYTD